MAKENKEEPEVEIYNEDQKFYANYLEKCDLAISNLEDELQLQKDIQAMLKGKIEQLK